jgi:peptidoglycan/LPS O-acetylase OafA/YrhL
MRGILEAPEQQADHLAEQVAHREDRSGVARPSRQPDGEARILPLDGVRGMAILLVLFFHLNLLRSMTPEHALDGFASRILTAGWCGVDLFFVLSGFLITRILYQAKESDRYFTNFYLRRTLRIFPLYYAVLVLTFIIIPHLPSGLIPSEKLDRWAKIDVNPLWYWFYLSNFSTAMAGSWGHGILDVTWSLAIEEQFYLLWPWIVYKFDRKRLLQACGLVFATAFITRGAMTVAGMSPIAIYVLTPARLDVLAAGAFVALVVAGDGGGRSLYPAKWIWLVTGAMWLGLMLWRGSADNMDPAIQTIGLSLVAMNLAALLAVVLNLSPSHWISRMFSVGFLRSFGKYSYAIYLAHLPLSALLRDSLYGPNQFLAISGSKLPGQILFYIFSIALIYAVAFASWHLWEKHFLRVRSYLTTRLSSQKEKPLNL